MKAKLLFEVPCFEKKGLVLRKVSLIKPDQSDIAYLFEKLRGLPSMFSPIELMDHQPLRHLFDPGIAYLLVDNVGLMSAGSSMIWSDGLILADVHIVFWDRVLRGREELARRSAKWAKNYRMADGVWTVIPASSKTVLAFAKRVGFEVIDWRPESTTDRYGMPDDAVILRLV